MPDDTIDTRALTELTRRYPMTLAWVSAMVFVMAVARVLERIW